MATQTPVVVPARQADDARAAHWSETLPPGSGRTVFYRIWLVPGTVAAGCATGLVLRWWPWWWPW